MPIRSLLHCNYSTRLPEGGATILLLKLAVLYRYLACIQSHRENTWKKT